MSKKIGVFALLFLGERIFLVKKNYGNKKWFLPGGSPLEGESLTVALRREIKEETGQLTPARALKHLGTFYLPRDQSVAFLFSCKLKQKRKITFNKKELKAVELFFPLVTKGLVSRETSIKIAFGMRRLKKTTDSLFEY